MIRRTRLVALLVALSSAAVEDAPAGPSASAGARVLTSIREDPSFKVRMQAIRVVVKQVKSGGMESSDEVFATLGKASESDEDHLVRGLACYALGELADERGRDALARALKDQHPFVRSQAEQALKALKPAVAPAGNGAQKRRMLLLAIEPSPGVETPAELLTALASQLGTELESQAQGYTISNASEGFGYKLSGSIADRSLVAGTDGGTKITIVVKITIATAPEGYLRHVMTAKASSASKSSGAGLAKAEQKVLQAAVSRAVRDSLAAISVE